MAGPEVQPSPIPPAGRRVAARKIIDRVVLDGSPQGLSPDGARVLHVLRGGRRPPGTSHAAAASL